MKIAAAAPPLPGCWNGQRKAMEEQEAAIDTPPRKKGKKKPPPKTVAKRRKEAAAKSEKQKGSRLAKTMRSGEAPLHAAELILAKLGESGKDHLRKAELKAWLKKRGLSAKGSKNDLLARVELLKTNVSI